MSKQPRKTNMRIFTLIKHYRLVCDLPKKAAQKKVIAAFELEDKRQLQKVA